jgi:large subunit ribosomal protein L9
MAVTEVILKENIPGLGAEADLVKVRRGFARNFLVPQGRAYEVTPANLKRLNLLKAKRADREAHELNEAEELARKINKVKLEFTLETGETGKAFGSVTAKDLEDKLLAEADIKIDRHRIRLERPIKESGEIEIPIQVHADVTATLKVEVKAHAPTPKETDPEGKDSRSKTRKRPKTTAS